MESWTQEQEKIVHKGTIKSSKDESLSVRVLNPSKGNMKAIYLEHQEKKQEKSKSLDGGLNPSKDKDKKKQEKTK